MTWWQLVIVLTDFAFSSVCPTTQLPNSLGLRFTAETLSPTHHSRYGDGARAQRRSYFFPLPLRGRQGKRPSALRADWVCCFSASQRKATGPSGSAFSHRRHSGYGAPVLRSRLLQRMDRRLRLCGEQKYEVHLCSERPFHKTELSEQSLCFIFWSDRITSYGMKNG